MLKTLRQIRAALRHLNPDEVRELADKRFTIGLLAADEEMYQSMMDFLLPAGISKEKRRRGERHIHRVEAMSDFRRCDFGFAEPQLEHPAHFYPFYPPDGRQVVELFTNNHPDIWIPVARHFIAFRDEVVERLIRNVARENALFAVATALPNFVPGLLGLPWALGEFASDTAILTINQVRLAFLIAAASDAPAGYFEQRGQIASIVTSAFGWRALARELVSKIPFGGGLAPKALIAFAGTHVVGIGLDRYLRVGRGLTAEEKREHYARAYEKGRAILEEIVGPAKERDQPVERWAKVQEIRSQHG